MTKLILIATLVAQLPQLPPGYTWNWSRVRIAHKVVVHTDRPSDHPKTIRTSS